MPQNILEFPARRFRGRFRGGSAAGCDHQQRFICLTLMFLMRAVAHTTPPYCLPRRRRARGVGRDRASCHPYRDALRQPAMISL